MNNRMARFVSDMRWYFHAAKAEIGIHSSWEPLVQIAMTGGSHSTARATGTGERDERRSAAIRRHARIEAALRSMPPEDVALVRLTCEEEVAILRRPYGDLGNCAHLTDAAVRSVAASRSTRSVGAWLDRLALKYASGRAGFAGMDAIDAIRTGCEDYMEHTREAYVRALAMLPQRRAA